MAAAIEPKLDVPTELERLFMAHHARVLKAAYRITGSMADAEDVAQTVFLRLWQGGGALRLPDPEVTANPESYLYRAGINAALDVLRKRQRDNTAPLDEALPAGRSALPDRDCAMHDLRAQLRRALALVGPRAAEIFVLRYLEDFDNREIARMLKTSPAVVAVILFRTRARLRKQLRAGR